MSLHLTSENSVGSAFLYYCCHGHCIKSHWNEIYEAYLS